jgi:hypothetical protein
MPDSILDRVRVVLHEPQNPINIAATVRAMKNFGVHDLRLVRPVPYDPYRLEGIAHDTHDIIDRIVNGTAPQNGRSRTRVAPRRRSWSRPAQAPWLSCSGVRISVSRTRRSTAHI